MGLVKRIASSIISSIIRPIRNIDVERRAHKAISKEKSKAAPQYEASKKQLKMAQELDPKFMEKHNKKDAKLDKNLKDVFVVSNDPVPDLSSRSDATKPLPHIRQAYEYADLDIYQIQNVREGKCSVQHVQTFLTDHTNDPQKHNASNIAKQYKLDIKVVENILEHYKVFRIITKSDVGKMGEEKEAQKKIGPAGPEGPPQD